MCIAPRFQRGNTDVESLAGSAAELADKKAAENAEELLDEALAEEVEGDLLDVPPFDNVEIEEPLRDDVEQVVPPPQAPVVPPVEAAVVPPAPQQQEAELVNSSTHRKEYAAMSRFCKSKKVAKFPQMEKMWNSGKKDELIKQWVACHADPDAIECSLTITAEQRKEGETRQELLTIRQMKDRGISLLFGCTTEILQT